MTEQFEAVSIDEVRAYWNARPCNIRHSPAPAGTREYFEQVEARKYLVEPHIPGFAQFERWKGKKVLELGCGIGTDTVNFARAGAQVTACDLSAASLALARQHADVMDVADRIEFFEANGEELERYVPHDEYDLVYSFGVVHHSPHPERVVEQLGRYLAPGGTLKLMVYHRHSWKVLGILVREAHLKWWDLQQAIARNSEAQTGCPVTYSYTRRSGAELARHGDVTIDEVRVDHIFPYRVSDYVQYRYVRTPFFRWMPSALFRVLEKRFGWHLLVSAHRP